MGGCNKGCASGPGEFDAAVDADRHDGVRRGKRRGPPSEEALMARWRAADIRANAMAVGGLHALNGTGFQPLDRAAGRRLIVAAAEAKSELARAHCLDQGWGTNGDPELARKIFKQLARRGLSQAQYWVGLNATDPATALRWFRRAAENRSGPAMYSLGCMYLEGAGVEASEDAGMVWVRRAADRGHSVAMCKLGSYLSEKRGDHSAAVEWWGRSADQGYPHAMFQLWNSYSQGRGVKKDIQRGLVWLRRAAVERHPAACQALLKHDSAEAGTKSAS